MTNKEKMEKGLKCIKNKTLLIIFIVTFILSIVMGIISACMSSDNEPVIDTSLDSNKIAIDGEIKISSQSTGFNKYKTTITGELFNMTNENINDIQLIFYVSNYEWTIVKLLASDLLTVYGNHEKYFSFEFQTDKKYNEIKKTSAIIKNNKEFDMLQKSSFIKMSTIETIFLIFGIILFLIAICVLTILIIKFLFEHFHLDKKIKNKINKTNKDVISINNNEIAILENEIRKEELKAKLKTVKNEDFVICKYCGTNNSNKNNICSHCGAPLNK